MSELHEDPEMDEQTEELDGMDADALRTQIEQKEQDIQKLKGHWGNEKSEMMKAQRALEQKLSELEGRVGEQRELFNSRKEPEKDPFELTEDMTEEFNNNPSKIAEYNKGYIQSQMKLMVDAITARDQYYENSISNTRGLVENVKKEFDPDRLAWKESIDELRKNEKLSKLDDETLIEIAKTQGKAPAMEYRGSSGGGGTRQAGVKAVAWDESRPDCSTFIQVAGGDVEKAKKWWTSSQLKKTGGK